jgi:uncharacterized protein DUF4347
MSKAVWAFSADSPAKTCEDAKYLGDGTKLYPGTPSDQGQPGWDIGLGFNTFADLTEKLKKLNAQYGAFSRLAIDVHGAPGAIVADSDNKTFTFDDLWQKYRSQLEAMNKMLDGGASLLIMGCNVGAAAAGDSFLIHLSEKFPGHKVVGITTIGETMRQTRSGGGCSEPGMKDSPYDNPSTNMPKMKEQREKEFLTLPWASEDSPHAKVALNGVIIRRPPEAVVATTNYSVPTYLPGTWSATIGNWDGYFVFEAGETCYWYDEKMQKHSGSWWVTSDSVQWSFEDDPAAWKRVFRVNETGLKSTLNGTVTIKGINHGAFILSKQADDSAALGELVGKWTVEVDRWSWIYEFDMTHNVRWTDPLNKMTGTGSWRKLSPTSMGISWKDSNTVETWRLPISKVGQGGDCLMRGQQPPLVIKATKQSS